MVTTALAESLDKPFPWAVGFLCGNTELSMELWTVIAGDSGAITSTFDLIAQMSFGKWWIYSGP